MKAGALPPKTARQVVLRLGQVQYVPRHVAGNFKVVVVCVFLNAHRARGALR